jgi:hypothetical protein
MTQMTRIVTLMESDESKGLSGLAAYGRASSSAAAADSACLGKAPDRHGHIVSA